METEAVSAGFYESPGWNQKYRRIQILTIEMRCSTAPSAHAADGADLQAGAEGGASATGAIPLDVDPKFSGFRVRGPGGSQAVHAAKNKTAPRADDLGHAEP